MEEENKEELIASTDRDFSTGKEVETKEELPDVMSDRDKIEQVLVILIDNALRYAKTKVRLIVNEDKHDVFISVWDDGCGISKDSLSRLFERFYKVLHRLGVPF